MTKFDAKIKEYANYLEKQQEMHSYIDGKIKDTELHKGAYDAYSKAAEYFDNLFVKRRNK